ncbi:hypothetical protein FM106_19325 [Brachybacterium faecium]|nr:hypothetical protein FM106_19325 [Brachybacterium faecium]
MHKNNSFHYIYNRLQPIYYTMKMSQSTNILHQINFVYY